MSERSAPGDSLEGKKKQVMLVLSKAAAAEKVYSWEMDGWQMVGRK